MKGFAVKVIVPYFPIGFGALGYNLKSTENQSVFKAFAYIAHWFLNS